MSIRTKLVEEIERVFDNVKLGDGIGIYEAEALDNCVSDKLLAKARAKDIRDDWKKIPEADVAQYYSAMSFMDHEGLRFAIPAYMRFAVLNYDTSNATSDDFTIYALARDEDWDFFTNEQKRVIAEFLKFMVMEADEYVDSWQASLAYEKYWSRYE